MSKKIKILIAGSAGSGKSTLAATLAAILTEAGFECTLADPDVEMDGLIDYLGARLEPRMEALRQAGLEIDIETEMTMREGPTIQ